MDREKVTKGLHCCARTDGRSCIYCPYDSAEEYCTAQMSMDVLDLLKSKQAEIERLTKPADGTWIQKSDATGREYSMCSACETVINTPDGCGGYYKLDMTGAKYCPNCGAKMD